MITLLISTRNPHKVEEIQTILGSGFNCSSVANFSGAPEVVEDQVTFAENAAKKAVELANWVASHRALQALVPQFVLADDSGLEVDALDGAPGVYSARFAAFESGSAGNSEAAANNAKLLRLLQNVPIDKRTARFRCVIALTPLSTPDNAPMAARQTELFEGVCEGRIGFEPRGQGGFGYDPLFIPLGHEQTFGELGENIKNQLSHRAKALGKLKVRLST